MESGDILQQYVFVEWLGEGGMAEVWRGRHTQLDYEVAMKFLKPQFAHDADLQERFLNEGKRQANLEHPNIVRAIDFISDGTRNFLVTKYIEGGSLEDRIKEMHGPLSVEEALAVSRQVLSALDYAHRQGVIHRDVKSSNILRDREGNCYLTDFGIALTVGEQRLTRTGATIGTAYYMSPEQIRSPHNVDHRTDIYSFGVILFEMLTGAGPFAYENEFLLNKAHVEEPPPRPSKLNPAVSKAVESVVLRALAKEPDDRWAGCEEMSQALQAAVRGASSGTRVAWKATVPAVTVVNPESDSMVGSGQSGAVGALPRHGLSARLLAFTLGGAGIIVASLLAAWEMKHFDSTAHRPAGQATVAQRESVTTPTSRPQPERPRLSDRDALDRVASKTPEQLATAKGAGSGGSNNAGGTPSAALSPKPSLDVPLVDPGSPRPSSGSGGPAPVPPLDPGSLLILGRKQLDSDPVGARESFRKAADAGNLQALVLLGVMYSQGLGGEKDYVEAIRIFRQAADMGYAGGMFNLGLMYENEHGVPKGVENQALAAYWYAKALKGARMSLAAYRLGMMYEEGRGVQRDLNQAAQLYRLAGTPEATTRLARMRP